jgi:hypothetical protein
MRETTVMAREHLIANATIHPSLVDSLSPSYHFDPVCSKFVLVRRATKTKSALDHPKRRNFITKTSVRGSPGRRA